MRHEYLLLQSSFVRPLAFLVQEKQEAERKKIEATGIRDAHLILTEGMNSSVIQWRSLEVLGELADSPNSKLIITDGKTPVLINTEEDDE